MTRPLTKSQAFLLTLYTGALLMDGEEFRKVIEKKLERTVYPVEFAEDAFIRSVQELYEPDWKALTNLQEDSGIILPKA